RQVRDLVIARVVARFAAGPLVVGDDAGVARQFHRQRCEALARGLGAVHQDNGVAFATDLERDAPACGFDKPGHDPSPSMERSNVSSIFSPNGSRTNTWCNVQPGTGASV